MPTRLTTSILRLTGLIALSGIAAWGSLALGQKLGSATDSSTLLARRIALGEQLFSDFQLSIDGTVRCASCHMPDKSYADGRQVAVGVGGRMGTRNTPSLLAVEAAQETSFFWDGRRADLNQAVLDPLTNPVEMGLPDQVELVRRVQHNPKYGQAFSEAFPRIHTPVTAEQIATALSDYVLSLRSQESNYDRYTLHGDSAALSPRALRGLAIFKDKGRCVECHQLKERPAAFTDHAYHRTGVGLDAVTPNLAPLTAGVVQRTLQGSALGNRIAMHADEAQLGRFNATLEPTDIGLFRTPSLRNVSHTAPYMHDGSVATLDEAIDREIYYRNLQSGRPLSLNADDRASLKAFLESL